MPGILTRCHELSDLRTAKEGAQREVVGMVVTCEAIHAPEQMMIDLLIASLTHSSCCLHVAPEGPRRGVRIRENV